MRVNREAWLKRREEFWRRLIEDEEIGYLDPDIKELLIEFFRDSKAYTLSSCSGRITLVDAPMPWVREPSSVVFKKHSRISLDEVLPVINGPVAWRLWLIVTGPIIHVSTIDIDEAINILGIARRAGFKHSGILAIGGKGVIVELMTGVRMTTLIRDGEVYVIPNDEEALRRLISVANEALMEGKSRLNRLLNELRNYLRSRM